MEKKNYFVKIYNYGLSYYLTTSRKWSDYFFDDRIDESCLFEDYTLEEMQKIVEEEKEINNIASYEICEEENIEEE